MKKINFKKFSKILKEYYSSPMVKAVRVGTNKPAYEKIIDMWHTYSLHPIIWADIKAFRENDFNLTKEQIELEKQAWNSLGYDLIPLDDIKEKTSGFDDDILLVGESITNEELE